jgi:hypothetical protein
VTQRYLEQKKNETFSIKALVAILKCEAKAAFNFGGTYVIFSNIKASIDQLN